MAETKTTIYSIHADNFFDEKYGGLWHTSELHTTGTTYEEAYQRITELIPKVFTTGEVLRYIVFVGVWDSSMPIGAQYDVLSRKEFRKCHLPDTLEAYDAAKSE